MVNSDFVFLFVLSKLYIFLEICYLKLITLFLPWFGCGLFPKSLCVESFVIMVEILGRRMEALREGSSGDLLNIRHMPLEGIWIVHVSVG